MRIESKRQVRNPNPERTVVPGDTYHFETDGDTVWIMTFRSEVKKAHLVIPVEVFEEIVGRYIRDKHVKGLKGMTGQEVLNFVCAS